MSAPYSGFRAIASSVAVSGSHATVTTSAAHGLVATDTVGISGAADAQINGTWTIASSASPTTFVINYSSFITATGGAGGNVVVLRQSITIPGGGDARNASSVNVPFEGVEDQVAWLLQGQGRYACVDIKSTKDTSGVAIPIGSQSLLFGLSTFALATGDILETIVSGTTEFTTGGSGSGNYVLSVQASFDGGSTYGSAGSTSGNSVATGSSNLFAPFSILATIPVGAVQSGFLMTQLWGGCGVTGGVYNMGEVDVIQKLWRFVQ